MNDSSLVPASVDDADDACLLTDCGQASKVTCGLPNQLAFEMGWPPNNRMYFT